MNIGMDNYMIMNEINQTFLIYNITFNYQFKKLLFTHQLYSKLDSFLSRIPLLGEPQ